MMLTFLRYLFQTAFLAIIFGIWLTAYVALNPM